MKADSGNTQLTFWDHLDEQRGVLVRCIILLVLLTLVAFCFREELFGIVLAPKKPDFCIYGLFCRIAEWIQLPSLCPDTFYVRLINTELAGQFLTHMSVAFYAGLLLASPYILYQLFRFVSPALYEDERKYSLRVVVWGYVLFMLGVLLNYFLIFPLTFRFLALYQVSAEVENTIVLTSYIDMLMMLSLMMGIVFEIPILCWLFAQLGLLTASFMRTYRKHAIVVVLVIAAVITPTSDVFTLLMVAFPMVLLYEASILVVRRVEKNKLKTERQS